MSELTTNTWQWKPYLMALAFVCFGVALGVSMDRLYLHHQVQKPAQSASLKNITMKKLIQFFSLRLKLSPKQHKEFKALLRTHLGKALQLMRTQPPEVQRFIRKGMGIRKQFRESIRTILNESQKKLFNKMVQDADNRRFELHFHRFQLQKELQSTQPSSKP